jgi:hypothetical protein
MKKQRLNHIVKTETQRLTTLQMEALKRAVKTAPGIDLVMRRDLVSILDDAIMVMVRRRV